MDSVTEDESDGLDDSGFQAEHEKYLEDVESRTHILHQAEERRLLVTPTPLSKRHTLPIYAPILSSQILTVVLSRLTWLPERSKCD